MFSLTKSVIAFLIFTGLFLFLLMKSLHTWSSFKGLQTMVSTLFPLSGTFTIFYFSMFCFIAFLNLISLVAYSYPITTTLAFNFSAAFMLWFLSVLLLTIKRNSVSPLVPSNSPWYLISFLSVVEMVSIIVRPITLCFRLLANMSAGHILLSLISKLPFNTWILGTLFGMLELMVALVQSFVFFMLVSVYFEEAMSH